MHGSVNTVEFILMVVVVIVIIAFSLPWIGGTIDQSLDAGELASIKNQFKVCSNKILETARTGTTNKCIFSISRGKIEGRTEGLQYSLVSKAPICTPHLLTIIDEQSHIYQECAQTGETKVYKMLWMFPSQLKVEAENLLGSQIKGDTPIGSIDFGTGTIVFRTLTLLVEFDYSQDQIGTNVELTRISMSTDKVYIGVKIY